MRRAVILAWVLCLLVLQPVADAATRPPTLPMKPTTGAQAQMPNNQPAQNKVASRPAMAMTAFGQLRIYYADIDEALAQANLYVDASLNANTRFLVVGAVDPGQKNLQQVGFWQLVSPTGTKLTVAGIQMPNTPAAAVFGRFSKGLQDGRIFLLVEGQIMPTALVDGKGCLVGVPSAPPQVAQPAEQPAQNGQTGQKTIAGKEDKK